MAVQIFRGRMHDDVRAQFQRALQRRRQKSVVHAHFGAVRVGDLANAGNVGQHHQRIAGRFNVHQLRVRLHRRFHCGQVARVDILDLDAIAAHDLVEQPHRAGIHVARTNALIARAQHRHQR